MESPKRHRLTSLESINCESSQHQVSFQKNPKWKAEENKLLVLAYLNAKKDPADGNRQKEDAFWLRVAEYYDAHRDELKPRTKQGVKKRWYLINAQISRFAVAYSRATCQKTSDQTEGDVMRIAYSFYEADVGDSFGLEYAWCMLKDSPKWKPTTAAGRMAKRAKLDHQELNCSSSSNKDAPSSCKVEEAMENPEVVALPIGFEADERVDEVKEMVSKEDMTNKLLEVHLALSRKLDEANKSNEEKIRFKKEKELLKLLKREAQLSDLERAILEKYKRELGYV